MDGYPDGRNWMKRERERIRYVVLLILVLGLPLGGFGEDVPLTVNEILKKAEKYPGADQRSKITFRIKEKDGTERKMVALRFWKNYEGQDGIDSKTLIFNEYPPEQRDSAFMAWSYRAESGKPDEQWIYIPFIRKIQKLPGKGDESFQGSDLKASDMAPRSIDLDSHRLIREETIENQDYYVIESRPKRKEPNYPYSKIVKWVTKDNFLKEMLDYYDEAGKLLKKQTISWKKVGDVWVWEKVVMMNIQNSTQTVLSFSDIQVGAGLSDSFFSERSMKAGLASVKVK
jgi:outer membrane lipoprotein-sorting protein